MGHKSARAKRKKSWVHHWIGLGLGSFVSPFLVWRCDFPHFHRRMESYICNMVSFALYHACVWTNDRGQIVRVEGNNMLDEISIGKTVNDIKYVEMENMENLPSRRIPILRHFRSRQYWHWFLWCWSIGQFRLPRHVYVRFRRTERLKNDLQPEKWKRKAWVTNR